MTAWGPFANLHATCGIGVGGGEEVSENRTRENGILFIHKPQSTIYQMKLYDIGIISISNNWDTIITNVLPKREMLRI